MNTKKGGDKLGPAQERFLDEQYKKHAASIYRKCLMLGSGNTQWAEDVTHDVFIRLMEKGPKENEPDSNILRWLHTVAYRLGMDRLRREQSIWRRVKVTISEQYKQRRGSSPERKVQTKRDLRKAWELLDSLPPRERTVVIMKHLDGMSQTEISQTLNLSEGYVSKLLKRAIVIAHKLQWEILDD